MLKQAAVALRSAMETALRPLHLTVPQYACLELLGQRPGLSNAELARGVFVTRQSMNTVLRGLDDRGPVTHPAVAPHGRELPTELTGAGHGLLDAASTAVLGVQTTMCTGLTATRQKGTAQDSRTLHPQPERTRRTRSRGRAHPPAPRAQVKPSDGAPLHRSPARRRSA